MLRFELRELGWGAVGNYLTPILPSAPSALDQTCDAVVDTDQGASTNWALRAVTRVEWPQ